MHVRRDVKEIALLLVWTITGFTSQAALGDIFSLSVSTGMVSMSAVTKNIIMAPELQAKLICPQI